MSKVVALLLSTVLVVAGCSSESKSRRDGSSLQSTKTDFPYPASPSPGNEGPGCKTPSSDPVKDYAGVSESMCTQPRPGANYYCFQAITGNCEGCAKRPARYDWHTADEMCRQLQNRSTM